MSFKLQDRIQQIKGMPGKYKRVLLALAQRARNDGTNIYESKETYAGKAGVSRWTIYRNLPDLIGVGIVIEATTHKCGNDHCPKGSTHSVGGGHYTCVYDINIAMLQNTTQLVEKLCSKMPTTQRSKMPKSNVAKCDAILSYDSRFACPTDDSSVLTNGLVSESVSESSVASRPTSLPKEKQTPDLGAVAGKRLKPSDDLWNRKSEQAWLAQERIPFWSEELSRRLDIKEVVIAEELYLDLIPMGKMDEADIVTLYELALAYDTDDYFGSAVIRSIWHWNKLHKKDSLQFHTIQALAKAMRSESDNNVVIQWHEHNRAECPKCKKQRKCVHCRLIEDCVSAEEFLHGEWRGEYLHKHCVWSWQEKQCRPVEMPPMQFKAEPVGENLEYERREQQGDCARCIGYGRTVCACEGDPDDIDLTPDNEYVFVAKGGFEVEEPE